MNFTTTLLLPLFAVISYASSTKGMLKQILECPWDKINCSEELDLVNTLSGDDLDTFINAKANYHMLHSIENFQLMDAILKKTKNRIESKLLSSNTPFTSRIIQYFSNSTENSEKTSECKQNEVKLMALLLCHGANETYPKFKKGAPTGFEQLKADIQAAVKEIKNQKEFASTEPVVEEIVDPSFLHVGGDEKKVDDDEDVSDEEESASDVTLVSTTPVVKEIVDPSILHDDDDDTLVSIELRVQKVLGEEDVSVGDVKEKDGGASPKIFSNIIPIIFVAIVAVVILLALLYIRGRRVVEDKEMKDAIEI